MTAFRDYPLCLSYRPVHNAAIPSDTPPGGLTTLSYANGSEKS